MKTSKDLDPNPWLWVYFLVFTAANALLAYSSLGIQAKLWVGLVGLVLPLLFAFRNLEAAGPSAKVPYGQETLPRPKTWTWITLVALAIALRLAQTHVPDYWPVWDDARFAYHSVQLSQKWSWHFLYTPTQHPPLFFWTLGLFFKIFEPSLLTLWLFPALCSILAFGLFTWAARMAFSRSFSVLCGYLMAFSFWPLYTGRFCMYMVLYLLWEALTFVLLMRLLGEKDGKAGKKKALWLGLALGVGFFTAIAWPVVAFMVLVAVGWHFKDSWRKERVQLAAVFLPTVLLGTLFLWASSLERNGVHVGQLWAFGQGMDLTRQLVDSFSNLSALFWGCDLQNSYGPVWGGVLDPVLGGAFFIGILECFRFRSRAWIRWTLLAFAVLLLPGALTRNFDLFRNVQALPVVLLITAIGIQAVLLSLEGRKGKGLVLLILTLCVGLDLRHLWLSYHPAGLPAGSNGAGSAYAKAYGLLKEKREKAGVGMVLFDLKPHEADQTLAVATYGFNAAVDPHIPLRAVKWVGLVVNANYQPFLEERFPKGQWSQLFERNAEGDPPQDPQMLAIIPVEELKPGTLETWAGADHALREVVWSAADLPEDKGREGTFEKLTGIGPLMEGDPLLGSLYWETVFKFNAWENAFGDRDYPTHTKACYQALNQALQKGYPTAFFYNELGVYYGYQGDRVRARECFWKAVHCKMDLTLASKALKALDREKKD